MLSRDTESVREIRDVLRRFQAGYTARDLAAVDTFMADLFVLADDLLVVGTGSEEWCRGPAAVRDLVASDWDSWGDVRLDIDNAQIGAEGDAGWLTTRGTVCRTMEPEKVVKNHLEAMRHTLDDAMSPKAKLLELIRGATNTLFEAERGAEYIWPFRFSGVLVRRGNGWRFQQMQFSFPTNRFPDERTV